MTRPLVYVGDHQHARVVCQAFAEGCNGRLVPATSPLEDNLEPIAMWGILRGAGDRIKECEARGKPYFYIDHGYFHRGHYDGHYRVCFNERHLTRLTGIGGRKWQDLDLDMAPMTKPGKDGKILYLPISRHVAAFLGIDPGEYDEQQIKRLGVVFDGEIVVSPKGDKELDFEGYNLVIGFQSNALIEASLAGHWIQELGNSPAKLLQKAAQREQVFARLADNQWTLDEMRSGKCWEDLMALYGPQLEKIAA